MYNGHSYPGSDAVWRVFQHCIEVALAFCYENYCELCMRDKWMGRERALLHWKAKLSLNFVLIHRHETSGTRPWWHCSHWLFSQSSANSVDNFDWTTTQIKSMYRKSNATQVEKYNQNVNRILVRLLGVVESGKGHAYRVKIPTVFFLSSIFFFFRRRYMRSFIHFWRSFILKSSFFLNKYYHSWLRKRSM